MASLTGALLTLTEELELHKKELDKLKLLYKDKEDDELILYRYLRGYSYNIDDAITALDKNIAWRDTIPNFKTIRETAHKLKQIEFPHADVILHNYPHNILHNYCINGSPISIERLGLIVPGAFVKNILFEEFFIYYVYHLENKLHLVNELSRKYNRFVGNVRVMDLEGFGVNHLGSDTMGFFRRIILAAQENYPEMLEKCFVINAPWLFSSAWSVIKGWLNARIASKVNILGADFKGPLTEYVEPKYLPTWAAGTCECSGGCLPGGLKIEYLLQNVPAGKSYEYKLDVDDDCDISWAFSINGRDINFEVINLCQDGTVLTVFPKESFTSEKRIDGYGKLKRGHVKLIWDNSYSYFTSKDIQFVVGMNKPTEYTKE